MTSTLVDRGQFLHHLKQSRLLTAPQLRVVVDKLGRIDSAREIAKALVKWKLLTKYQARMLLQGRSSNQPLPGSGSSARVPATPIVSPSEDRTARHIVVLARAST